MLLRELRKNYRITMQELADSISVSKQLIGQIEKGKRVITNDVLNKLVEYFGLERITDNYRGFLMKDTMTNIEVSLIKLNKIEKESEEIELEVTDPNTGERHISRFKSKDESAYMIERYKLRKAVLEKKINDRLSSIIDTNMREHEGYTEYGFEQAVLEADNKVAFYKEIVDLDLKADPYIFKKIVRALSIATNTGEFDSDIFTNKLVKVINEELRLKEKERQERVNRYGKKQ